jgi:ankyrin repeat protein
MVQMNIRDAHGFTALHLAAGMGHANVVAYLLEKGANASIKDQVRCPVNHSRCIRRHIDAVMGGYQICCQPATSKQHV